MKLKNSIQIKYILVGLFVVIGIMVGCFIFKLASISKSDWVKNKETKSTIINIYEGYKGKPNYQIMKLLDSQSFTIPKKMIGIVQIGDSVIKEKDSSFYIFILQKSKRSVKVGWQ